MDHSHESADQTLRQINQEVARLQEQNQHIQWSLESLNNYVNTAVQAADTANSAAQTAAAVATSIKMDANYAKEAAQTATNATHNAQHTLDQVTKLSQNYTLPDMRYTLPETFNGDHRMLKEFLSQLTINFWIQPQTYPTEQTKINLAVSLLRGTAN